MIYQKMTEKFTRFIANVNQCKPSKLRIQFTSICPPMKLWIQQHDAAQSSSHKYLILNQKYLMRIALHICEEIPHILLLSTSKSAEPFSIDLRG